MSEDFPVGTLTFLFTDVEGSTRLVQELGTGAYVEVLEEHRRTLREVFRRHHGVEVGTEGDAFFVVFSAAPEAVKAAREAQEMLAGGPVRVRMGLHTGTAQLVEDDYVGADVHLAARVTAAAHGGQVVVSGATAALAPSQGLTALGEHRLRDFSQPVPLFQLGEETFPPLKTISNTNVPRPATSFVGREREVGEVASVLRGGARLLTLTGPGGTGKTRLSIEAASEVIPYFKDGVFWVELAPVRDPALVTEKIAQSVGATDGLAGHVGQREVLLVLDNFEQVVEAAPELPSLLEECPRLKILVTSRERLRVRGEVEYAVPPLSEAEAVQLFSTRSSLEPDAAIVELCRRLDDLPLAIELAAARTSVLSPQQIVERLAMRLDLLRGGRDAAARQGTLRATIEWSHDLLSAEEQTLFARLAVFRGGATLESAETVAEVDIDTMQSLVDKNLLRHRNDRFWMLETIRDFSLERLEASGEAEDTRRRHAAHYLALAERAFPNLKAHPEEWLEALEREHDNLRAACDWFTEIGDTQQALQLAGALYRFWYLRGYFIEGFHRLESALGADDRPTAARGRALHGAAVMVGLLGDRAAVRSRLEEALSLYRTLSDAWGVAYSVFLLAHTAADEGDFETARDLYQKSVRSFGELGDDHYTLVSRDGLAWMYGKLGEDDRRRGMHEDVLRQARELSDQAMVALSLDQLAEFALRDGRITEAFSMLRESLGIFRDLGDRDFIVANLAWFSQALAAVGRAETAALLLARAESLREEIGGGEAWAKELIDETGAKLRSQLDDATWSRALRDGRKLTVDGAIDLALAEAGVDEVPRQGLNERS